MRKVRNLNLTWKRLIIFALISGVYTGVVAMIPILKDTSFRDISMTFEWWVLFGIFIIMSSKSSKDAALKCLVFFLISQPLVYLVQVPFNPDGFGIFRFYPGWFKWTLCTIPMGYIGYYMKKDKWYGLLILIPMLIFLGFHYEGFLSTLLSSFPNHLLSVIFCLLTMIFYPIYIFRNKKIRITSIIISIIILIIMTFVAVNNEKDFYTTVIMNSDSGEIKFDDKYEVYLKDKEYGDVLIIYDDKLDTYIVEAKFKKEGKTEFVIVSPNGDKNIYDITIKKYSFDLVEK